MTNFKVLNEQELSDINGGVVPIIIGGALVLKGAGVVGGAFTLGYMVGKGLR
ncbi:class IIb bacteriocin, lactobin A/cerein 7B family [Leuconostoc gelidum]|uniref:class IIb bacteriocin, lactobin A/cerein 7B family n=1 Tax=Leuconostoc gelidum TaxID=1244 RepID=UPI00021920E6|nr:class IIb bacteriocin, lactobin A/cerein 7B family [Leuconostoc gelidum]MBZ5992192.1 class IIb bacteriocin, lactobin A/cerein 7B family [Leuconostoc gelidum subsp. gelidum]USP17341.1 class IIb bacteriocin, lactobin A/cerein 7B family [Leuconostoc gelidum subsp. aenigmaticum]GMA67276.1 hypothetical protein GCM10025884_09030 [Leuconostoc gelidum subsp. gelidum]